MEEQYRVGGELGECVDRGGDGLARMISEMRDPEGIADETLIRLQRIYNL